LIYVGPKGQQVVRGWLRADPDQFLFTPAEAEDERRAERRRNRKTRLTPSPNAHRRKRQHE
jgi:hypothetical protein